MKVKKKKRQKHRKLLTDEEIDRGWWDISSLKCSNYLFDRPAQNEGAYWDITPQEDKEVTSEYPDTPFKMLRRPMFYHSIFRPTVLPAIGPMSLRDFHEIADAYNSWPDAICPISINHIGEPPSIWWIRVFNAIKVVEFGIVKELRVKGDMLQARLSILCPELRDRVKRGDIRDRSISIAGQPPLKTYLRAVAFCANTAPTDPFLSPVPEMD